MCNHQHKVCKNLKWGNSYGAIKRLTDDAAITKYNADVALYFCNDCSRYMYYDWHTQTMTMLHKKYKEPA